MESLFPGQESAFQPGSASSPSPTTPGENLPPVENIFDTPGGEHSLPCRGHLKKLFSCKTVRVVPPEHAIFSQGDPPHTVCLICSGQVKLTRTESDGNQAIVGLRQKGWMLGAVSLLLNSRYETTAATITRSNLCFVSAETFLRAINTDLEFSQWMLMILSRGLKSSMLSIGERSCLSGRQRLEKFLREVVGMQNGIDHQKPIKIQMVLRNWEIAQLLALTPQHLCRLVKQMENEGVVVRKKGWLILPDPQRLWRSERAAHGLS